jgi:ATP-dependent Clp protease ATP-binding subunit ClpB
MTAYPLPSWTREVLTLLPACAHFLLSGNVRDKYLVAPAGVSPTPDGDPRVLYSLQLLLAENLRSEGISTTIEYNISDGPHAIPRDNESARRAEELLGEPLKKIAPPGSLGGLAQLIKRVSNAHEPVALIIQSASRLVRDVAQLSDDEFEFFRTVDRTARISSPCPFSPDRPLFNPIIWILDSERDVPNWFSLGNELLRSIVVPLPHTGERQAFAARLMTRLAGADEPQSSQGAQVLTEQTAGMTLVAMEQTVAIAQDQGLGPERVEDAARSYRVGVTDNPWRADYLIERLQRECLALTAESVGDAADSSVLASRVLGQDVAVRRALDILVRSSTGLTAAQASATATRPRGVLFFAGPTGVGKTELAKALTKLLFDDERFYIRFDMSEFSAEEAANRLIGAPPAYVGFGAGGELTNAIRQRPFSLVLFDEIEKAHPRILDKFLQLLDDGRLTDGRGETVFFTEAVIVFTSNLGIYTESEEPNEHGVVVRRRRPTVDRTKMTHAEMAFRVERAIRDYFTLQLGRPELLNRIGDNIVVFDYIDEETGGRILRMMLDNIAARVGQEYQVKIAIPSEVLEELGRVCLDKETLELGGRGIGSKLETTLVNPLANELFLNHPAPDSSLVLRLKSQGEEWTVKLLPG